MEYICVYIHLTQKHQNLPCNFNLFRDSQQFKNSIYTLESVFVGIVNLLKHVTLCFSFTS